MPKGIRGLEQMQMCLRRQLTQATARWIFVLIVSSCTALPKPDCAVVNEVNVVGTSDFGKNCVLRSNLRSKIEKLNILDDTIFVKKKCLQKNLKYGIMQESRWIVEIRGGSHLLGRKLAKMNCDLGIVRSWS